MKTAVAERTDRFVSPLLSVIVSPAAFLRWCVCKIEQTSRLAWSRGYLQCFWRPLNYFPKWHRNRKKRVTFSAALLSGDDKMCKFICDKMPVGVGRSKMANFWIPVQCCFAHTFQDYLCLNHFYFYPRLQSSDFDVVKWPTSWLGHPVG